MFFPDITIMGLDVFLCIGFLFSFILIIVFYFSNYWPLATHKHTHLTTVKSQEPISIIICARNEDDNLTEFLPKILTQNYPEYEVIVVDDCSHDSTEAVIDEFAKIFPNLKKIVIKEDDYYKHGKKFAIMVGIKGAKYENLVFTDADCYPANENWLQEMASGFSEGKDIVLGYGAYEKKKGIINKLIRFDTLSIGLHYLSAVIKNSPYMGVGRNLGYKKSLFFKHKGFANHYHINSGDDDLFINQVGTDSNTNIAVSKDAITYSVPKENFNDWKIQKIRHLTTAPHYKPTTKTHIILGFVWQYLFHAFLISLLFFKTTLIIAGVGYLLKIILQMIVLKKGCDKLNERDLWYLAFWYEFLLLLIYPVFHISKLLYRPNKWKN